MPRNLELAMQEDTLSRLNYACGILQGVTTVIRDETNDAVASDDHIALIKHYDKLRQVNALIKESREALSQIEEKLSREQVPSVMRAHQIKTITVEGVGRVSLG